MDVDEVVITPCDPHPHEDGRLKTNLGYGARAKPDSTGQFIETLPPNEN